MLAKAGVRAVAEQVGDHAVAVIAEVNTIPLSSFYISNTSAVFKVQVFDIALSTVIHGTMIDGFREILATANVVKVDAVAFAGDYFVRFGVVLLLFDRRCDPTRELAGLNCDIKTYHLILHLRKGTVESQVQLGKDLFVVAGMDAELGGNRSDHTGFASFLAGYIDHISRLEIEAVVVVGQFDAMAVEANLHQGFDGVSSMFTTEIQ